MSILLTHTSAEVLDALERLCQLTLYAKLKPDELAAVREHFQAMRQTKANMDTQVDFATDPVHQTTSVTFTISHGGPHVGRGH